MASTTTTQLPAKMQAIGINQTGDFEVIEKLELPVPQNAPGNVLVKVHYGGVNFIDTYFRKGLYPISSFPQPLGTEAAGEIVGLPTDEKVLNDEEYKLRGFSLGGKVAVYGLGAFAEYVSVPWQKTYALPAGLSTRTAAAGLTQGGTVLTFITEAYDVQKGDVVLVHTVAGGLGLIFAQLLKARGATVIGTTSTPEKAAIAREYGADHVILYKQEDTVQRVLELTNGEGVHAIFDGVGKDTFESDFKMIRRKGTIVSVGNASGAVPPFPPLKLVEKNVRLLRPTLANYIYTPEEGRRYSTELFRLIATGDLKIRIHGEYPFTAEGVQQAQKDLTGGKTVGKLIIKIAPPESE
ncbi:NAD-P-binding protein [Cubamyces sp. BRFM 1775]|nr:NAD-P-binding protein [Cubamyces sp. BRFM 1775]